MTHPYAVGDRVRVSGKANNSGATGYVEEMIDVIGKPAYGVWFDEPNLGCWFYFVNDLEPATTAPDPEATDEH